MSKTNAKELLVDCTVAPLLFYITNISAMYYVYILKGNKYYCGHTNDLDRRIKEHQSGKTYTTKRLGDFVLVGYYECGNREDAEKLEKRIKKNGHIERWTQGDGFIKK